MDHALTDIIHRYGNGSGIPASTYSTLFNLFLLGRNSTYNKDIINQNIAQNNFFVGIFAERLFNSI
jgi:hypothetical protein